MEKSEWIWMNGEYVPWDNANVHVLSHGLHYGTGVFEGIRAYETDRGTAIFRHREHLERLVRSAQLYYMELPYSVDGMREATHELIRRNGLKSCYIRPLAFRGYGGNLLSVLFPNLRRDALSDEVVAALIEADRVKTARDGMPYYAVIVARPRRLFARRRALRAYSTAKPSRIQAAVPPMTFSSGA